MVSKIPRSRGVATLNQDSLETKDLIQIRENSILIENYIERILFEYTRLGTEMNREKNDENGEARKNEEERERM